MLYQAITTAFRSLLANKKFTFLNIIGLALGISTYLFIVLYVADELSFDSYNINAGRIYRVNTNIKSGETYSAKATTSPAIGPALANQFPEVEKATRLLTEALLVKKGDQYIHENKVAYCDSSIFDVFTLPLIAGNAQTALLAPNSVVISESTALKYFNGTNAVGQPMYFARDSVAHQVTAVMRDIPVNSHFHFDILLSMVPVSISRNKAFNAFYPFSTYLLLKQYTNSQQLEAAFPAFLKTHLDFLDEMEKTGNYIRINLTPLKDIHLKSNRQDELSNNGSYRYLQIFSVIAIFILFIACINFINLSTAQLSKRAKETGVRKVLGASRSHLIAKFLCESLIAATIAALIAIITFWLLLPAFNSIAGKNMSLSTVGWMPLITSIVSAVVVTGLLAGSYPAILLSAFNPVKVLTGNSLAGFTTNSLRNALVVFQFSVSIIMIVGTLVVYDQLNFIRQKDPGFKREQRLVLKNMNELPGNGSLLFKDAIAKISGVKAATLSSFYPMGDRRWNYFISVAGSGLQTQLWPVDENYVGTLGIQVLHGRNFSDQLKTDSSSIIINETAARMFGISKNPINQSVTLRNMKYNIIGVVKDFNFSSLKENITPLAMILMSATIRKYEGDGPDNLIVTISSENFQQMLQQAANKWKLLSGNHPFAYSFLDQDFIAAYNQEQRMGKLFFIFSCLAIFIACMGLFALATYNLELRNREISIRKVLGASVPGIVLLLSKDFFRLVLLAIIISIPTAWIFAQQWLQGYAYHTTVHAWVIASASFGAILLAMLTISYQAIKGAQTNPAQHLKMD